MKFISSLVLTLALAATPFVSAQLAPPEKMPVLTKTDPNEADLQTHDHYHNKAGQEVHSPAKSKTGGVPSGASAQCRDKTYSFSKNHRGTCSHHGGVANWL